MDLVNDNRSESSKQQAILEDNKPTPEERPKQGIQTHPDGLLYIIS